MTEELTFAEIKPETCFVPQTNRAKGRNISVKPGATAARYLHYGRIILDAGESLKFENADHETGLVCLKGKATILVGGERFEFAPYDSIYIPRDSYIEVQAKDGEDCDFAEISAPVENKYPLKFVSFSEDVRKDSTLHFIAGQPPIQRDLNVLLGKNVEAGRIMCGVTFSSEGNWTSFPPHEHAAMLEEAYLYIDMPAPSFGIQMVYTDFDNPELVQVVREGDVVLMPQGNHPNVAAPGGSINFLWMMAANREVVDRQFGVVNVQPEFDKGSSGLEAAHGK
ncbi:MAG: 5-deoxy-glucuronate isomerase [Acidobacteriota bacterium]|nr:5-deoxy-glucuronate isomerase [Acidobacteriota bacterium]